MFFTKRKPFCNVLALKHLRELYSSVITKTQSQDVYLKMTVAKMRNFQMPPKVMQNGSKGSVILLGLLPYT